MGVFVFHYMIIVFEYFPFQKPMCPNSYVWRLTPKENIPNFPFYNALSMQGRFIK